jgi:hypothetical protein
MASTCQKRERGHHGGDPLGVVGPGLDPAADARHRSLRDHGVLGERVLTRPADRPLAPFRLVGTRARTPAALANAAAESTPALPHAELDFRSGRANETSAKEVSGRKPYPSTIASRSMSGMDESDWSKKVLMPLLHRLGFIRVEYTHGPSEHGRDLVFAEFDRFGLLRFYGAQVKMGSLNASDGGSDLRDLLAQLHTAWEQKYRDAATGTEHRMSGVYLIASGKITPVARERLYEKTGQWLHLIDSDQLAVVEHASSVTVSTVERQNVIGMALLELNVMLRPDVAALAEAFATNVPNLIQPGVSLPQTGLLRAWEVLQDDLDSHDLSVLGTVLRETAVASHTLGRIPVGNVGGVEPTVRALGEMMRKTLPYCDDLAKILTTLSERERPAPGQRMARIGHLPETT